jgi:uncharacterized protein (TIGR02594 family)
MKKLIEVAFSQYGVKEIVGKKHNPVVVNYFKEIGFKQIDNDETPWCSAFINWCALKSGLEKNMSKKLNARSWLKVGNEIKDPVLGDIVIFWRENKDGWKGHVGIYINEDSKNINVLGGNQGNEVCIKPYPKDRLLGYRRLKRG